MPPRADPEAIRRHIAGLPGTVVSEDAGSWFFAQDPRGDPSPAAQIPYATIVTTDKDDPGSDLERTGSYRVNLGVGMESYRGMFGTPPPFPKDGGLAETGHDYRQRDRLMPHPIYAAMGWVCVVDPSPATFEALKPMLAEASALAARKRSPPGTPPV